MSIKFSIRTETAQDLSAISEIHEDAFGPGDAVSELVHGLRKIEGAFPTISLVAEDQDHQLLGHVMLSHAWLDAPKTIVDVLVLSPLGVRSQYQHQGIGTALLEHAKETANSMGAPLLFLEGSPTYYSQRGFTAATALAFHAPSLRIPDPAFQVVKLDAYSPEMTGTLVYRDIFWKLDCVGLRDTA